MAKTIWDISTKKEFEAMSAMIQASNNIIENTSTKLLKNTKWLVNKANIAKAWWLYLGNKLYQWLKQ
jgi:hypothetical protein